MTAQHLLLTLLRSDCDIWHVLVLFEQLYDISAVWFVCSFEQWLRSLCILWSWAKYLDHLPRQLIPLWSDRPLMVLVLVLVLYIGLVYCGLGLGQSIWTTWPGSWPHFGLIVLWWSPARPPLHFHIRTNAISAGKHCDKSAIHCWRNNFLIFVCHSRKIL